MSSKPGFIPTHVFELECTSRDEAEHIVKLIRQFKKAMDEFHEEELGTKSGMSDGAVVEDCLVNGVRMMRIAAARVKMEKIPKD